MNTSESFEIAARTFRSVTGHIAPGKNGCTHSTECKHDWNVWCRAVEYMKKCRSDEMVIDIDKYINERIPKGWELYTADFSVLSKIGNCSVMLRRDEAGMRFWHSLPENDQPEFEIYVYGVHNSFGGAFERACQEAKNELHVPAELG